MRNFISSINKKLIFLLMFSICGGLFASAQKLKTTIDRNDILIGEPFQYKLTFSFPNNKYNVTFNLPDSIPHFETLSKRKYDSSSAGEYLIVQEISLTSWDSGKWEVPSFPIKINADNAAAYTLNTDVQTINVGYAKADSSGQLRDIKPVIEVTYVDSTWILIALGALLSLIFIYLIIRYFIRKSKKKKIGPEYKLSAYDEAMQALDGLETFSVNNHEEAKQFYEKLGGVFKRYYTRKENTNLYNKTTREIVMLLTQNGASENVVSFIKLASQIGDATMFAKYLPPAYENEQCRQFVKDAIAQIEKVKQ